MSYLPYDGGSRAGWVAAFGLSTVLHGAVLAGVIVAAGSVFPQEEDTSRTSFTVTLERLDADTLAGIVEQAGLAGAEGEVEAGQDPTGEDPEVATPVTAPPPALEPVEPEAADPEVPQEPEIPEELVAETPDSLEPETLEAATAEALPEEPALMEPEVLAPEVAQPEAVAAIPVSPDTPDLSPILPETIAPGETLGEATALAPVAPAPTALAPIRTGPDEEFLLTPDRPANSVQTVTAVNAAPPAAPTPPRPQTSAAPPSAQDLAIGGLIERIRSAVSDPCLIALPRRDGEDGVGLAMIAAHDGAMESFAQDVLTVEDAAIRQTRTLVDPRQCPALTYIRQSVDYPATRMGMRIDELEITSGGRLTGVLRGGAGRYITLLLIDDNGVVQDLQRFMSFSGNLARFDVPVTRSGPSRDTSQILLALGTQRQPTVIRDRTGQLSQDVFNDLAGDLATGAYLAIATFDVR